MYDDGFSVQWRNGYGQAVRKTITVRHEAKATQQMRQDKKAPRRVNRSDISACIRCAWSYAKASGDPWYVYAGNRYMVLHYYQVDSIKAAIREACFTHTSKHIRRVMPDGSIDTLTIIMGF